MARDTQPYRGRPWEQQPGESDDMYARFKHYIFEQTPGKRTYSDTARAFGVSPKTIANVAEDYRWRERVRAWEAERTGQVAESILARDVELADRLMDDSRLAEGLLRRNLADILNSGVRFTEVRDLLGLAKLAVLLRDAANNRPDQVVQLVDNLPDNVPASLAGLSPEQRRDRVAEMARGLLVAIDGGKAS